MRLRFFDDSAEDSERKKGEVLRFPDVALSLHAHFNPEFHATRLAQGFWKPLVERKGTAGDMSLDLLKEIPSLQNVSQPHATLRTARLMPYNYA